VIEKREAPAFDAAAVHAAQHTHAPGPAPAAPAAAPTLPCGCPGTAARQFRQQAAPAACGCSEETQTPSALTHWPIQLHLIRPEAPPFQDADILVAADCTAFALGAFHSALLAGRSLVIACPKLDDDAGYREKLTAIFAAGRPRSVIVARMEVPCCAGLTRLVIEARDAARSPLAVREVIIGVEGGVRGERELPAAAAVS
jgi:hypothetical protein